MDTVYETAPIGIFTMQQELDLQYVVLDESSGFIVRTVMLNKGVELQWVGHSLPKETLQEARDYADSSLLDDVAKYHGRNVLADQVDPFMAYQSEEFQHTHDGVEYRVRTGVRKHGDRFVVVLDMVRRGMCTTLLEFVTPAIDEAIEKADEVRIELTTLCSTL